MELNDLNRKVPILFWHSSSSRFEDLEEKDLEIQKFFKAAMQFIDNNEFETYERAKSGSTNVYYSPDKKSVLKHCRSSSQSRLYNMEQAREICRKLNLVHIVIPLGFCYNDFLIEQNIPISKDLSTPTQVQFYLDNRDKFTDAAKELTRFFLHAYIGDLIDDVDSVKRDNIPLYLDPETGEGKVALIDLEELTLGSLALVSNYTGSECFDEEEDSELLEIFKSHVSRPLSNSKAKLPINPVLFQVFPAHLNEILEELEIGYPDIQKHREGFRAICEKTLQPYRSKACR